MSLAQSIVVPAVVCVLFSACGKEKNSVNYSVSCETCEVSYYDDSNEWTLREAATGSFTYDFEYEKGTEHSPGAEQFIKVIAQNTQGATGDIQVKLTVNGTTIKDTTGTGAEAIISAAWTEEE